MRVVLISNVSAHLVFQVEFSGRTMGIFGFNIQILATPWLLLLNLRLPVVLLTGAYSASAILVRGSCMAAYEIAGVGMAIVNSRGLRTAVRSLLLVGVGGSSETTR